MDAKAVNHKPKRNAGYINGVPDTLRLRGDSGGVTHGCGLDAAR